MDQHQWLVFILLPLVWSISLRQVDSARLLQTTTTPTNSWPSFSLLPPVMLPKLLNFSLPPISLPQPKVPSLPPPSPPPTFSFPKFPTLPPFSAPKIPFLPPISQPAFSFPPLSQPKPTLPSVPPTSLPEKPTWPNFLPPFPQPTLPKFPAWGPSSRSTPSPPLPTTPTFPWNNPTPPFPIIPSLPWNMQSPPPPSIWNHPWLNPSPPLPTTPSFTWNTPSPLPTNPSFPWLTPSPPPPTVWTSPSLPPFGLPPGSPFFPTGIQFTFSNFTNSWLPEAGVKVTWQSVISVELSLQLLVEALVKPITLIISQFDSTGPGSWGWKSGLTDSKLGADVGATCTTLGKNGFPEKGIIVVQTPIDNTVDTTITWFTVLFNGWSKEKPFNATLDHTPGTFGGFVTNVTTPNLKTFCSHPGSLNRVAAEQGQYVLR